ncbi:aminotransferase [Paenibacillus gansuensis]|uniref:Aminotransferase n=1 Tax=Paenibacillus gansuensis TaxID=306542 RepID=A0ABW5P856_9BACL
MVQRDKYAAYRNNGGVVVHRPTVSAYPAAGYDSQLLSGGGQSGLGGADFYTQGYSPGAGQFPAGAPGQGYGGGGGGLFGGGAPGGSGGGGLFGGGGAAGGGGGGGGGLGGLLGGGGGAASGGSKLPNLKDISAFVERMGGIEGIVNTMTKAQKFMNSVQQFAPMFKLLATSFGKKKADDDDDDIPVRRRRKRKRSSYKGKGRRTKGKSRR